jgi:hypothetical protein
VRNISLIDIDLRVKVRSCNTYRTRNWFILSALSLLINVIGVSQLVNYSLIMDVIGVS